MEALGKEAADKQAQAARVLEEAEAAAKRREAEVDREVKKRQAEVEAAAKRREAEVEAAAKKREAVLSRREAAVKGLEDKQKVQGGKGGGRVGGRGQETRHSCAARARVKSV